MTYEHFVSRAQKVHGTKYFYPSDILERRDEKGRVAIYCNELGDDGQPHGWYWQFPSNHFKGCGCPECSKNKRLTTDEFKNRLLKKYPNTNILLDEIDYINNHTPVTFICPYHGNFSLLPKSALENLECPECQKQRLHDMFAKTNEAFICELRAIFGDEYEYDDVEYKNKNSIIKLKCKKHGYFYRVASDLLRGKGCQACSYEKAWDLRGRMTTETFIERAKAEHGDKYGYSESIYTSAHEHILIYCKRCKKYFPQDPYAHMSGQGCPYCAAGKTESAGELEMVEFIIHQGVGDVVRNDRNIIPPYELDVYIPSKNIAFEYNGLYYHSAAMVGTDYHLKKTEMCAERGIRLFHVFEDEWLHKQEVVKSNIARALGTIEEYINATDCDVVTISNEEANEFLERNSLLIEQYHGICKGMVYMNKLVALAVFVPTPNKGVYDIIHSTVNNVVINDSLPTLIENFVEEYHPNSLITYIDRHYDDGSVFITSGFQLTETLPLSLYVIRNNKRYCIEEATDTNRYIYDTGWLVFTKNFQ